MFLDYLALVFLIFGALVTFYLIIAIHDIPYEIAKKRNHPHQDAIHVAGWVSLMTLHAIWPFLWIWSTIYRPDRGYGFSGERGEAASLAARIEELETRLVALEGKHSAGNESLETRVVTLEDNSIPRVNALEARLTALEIRNHGEED